MARWKERSKILERELANTQRAIHASALRRALPKWARRLAVDVNQLTDVAERSFCLCATCLGPIKTPNLYYVEGQLRALLCTPCSSAIERTNGDLVVLRRTGRFDARYRQRRSRIGRLVALHESPPT